MSEDYQKGVDDIINAIQKRIDKFKEFRDDQGHILAKHNGHYFTRRIKAYEELLNEYLKPIYQDTLTPKPYIQHRIWYNCEVKRYEA